MTLTTFASAATSFISSGLALANAGTLDLDGGVRIFSVADGAAATDLNISAAIGNGALTKSGAGTLVLSGSLANTYFGLTTISAGILDLQKSNGVNAFSGNTTVNGGVLRWQADEQIGNLVNLTLSSGTVNLNGHTETLGSFSNNGGSFMTGAGTLHGTGASITFAGGINTINGGGLVDDAHVPITGGTNTVEAGGTLKILGGSAGLEMTGSTLTLNSSSAIAGKLLLQGDLTTFASAATSFISSGLALANAGMIDLDGGTRTFTVADGAAATDLSISARIGNGALTKTGTGTMVLSGNNTYSGATIVNGGLLQVDGPGAALGATSGVTVGNTSAANFTVSGGGQVMSGGSILGNSNGSIGNATVTGAGSLWTIDGGSLVLGYFGHRRPYAGR